MHACIAGLSTAVPTVPVGYSIKARGITTQVFEGTGITPDSIVIPSDTFVDSAQCIPHMDSVWQRRDAIASALQSRLSAIKALAESNFDLLGPYLKKLNS
jgi:polysaccharide pyruvyl transferase WcaK-like protein